MIRSVHTMFYSSEPEALRAFLRDKLGFPATDVGGGWLIAIRLYQPKSSAACNASAQMSWARISHQRVASS